MQQHDLAPHRGSIILILGLLSIFFFIPGPIAWFLGRGDLKEMDAGRMDPEGRGTTEVGTIVGMVCTILWVIGVFLSLFAFLFFTATAVTVTYS